MKNLRIIVCITCFIVTQGLAEYMIRNASSTTAQIHTDGAWHQMQKYTDYSYSKNQDEPGLDLSGLPTADLNQVKKWILTQK